MNLYSKISKMILHLFHAGSRSSSRPSNDIASQPSNNLHSTFGARIRYLDADKEEVQITLGENVIMEKVFLGPPDPKPKFGYTRPFVSLELPDDSNPELYHSDDGKWAFHIASGCYLTTSVRRIASHFSKYQREWNNSEPCARFVRLLKSMIEDPSKPPVTNVVALATGSLHNMMNGSPFVKRSHLQLASVLTAAKVLGDASPSGKPLPCYIQDPSYSKLDVQFLTSLGLIVVGDPHAFDLISKNSLVCMVHPPLWVYRTVSLKTWPAAMFCNFWEESELEENPCAQAYSDGLRGVSKMFNSYTKEASVAGGKALLSELRGDDECIFGNVFLFCRNYRVGRASACLAV